MKSIPVIDISPFCSQTGDKKKCALEISNACCESGFFYISNHNISVPLQNKLETLSKIFFKLPIAEKQKIRMELGKHFWRGYFPIKGELTSGVADLKEGIYFGTELSKENILVQKNTPLHGPNLFPDIPEFKDTVLNYMGALTKLSQSVLNAISLSLGLEEDYFFKKYTFDPLILFRIFHYPQSDVSHHKPSHWGVGEHTDYGLLTLLKQDDVGGLEVKTKNGWVDAHPIPNTFVCNIGDMLDKITGGLYCSTPHRVRPAKEDRLSFPFFFDPNFFAKVYPIQTIFNDNRQERWDKLSVHEFNGTYGDYLLNKVGKVFPQLKKW